MRRIGFACIVNSFSVAGAILARSQRARGAPGRFVRSDRLLPGDKFWVAVTG